MERWLASSGITSQGDVKVGDMEWEQARYAAVVEDG